MRTRRRAAALVVASVRCGADDPDADLVVATAGATVLDAVVFAGDWPWPLASVRVGLVPADEATLLGPLMGLAAGTDGTVLAPLLVQIGTPATMAPGEFGAGLSQALSAVELPESVGKPTRWVPFFLTGQPLAEVAALVADSDWLGWDAPGKTPTSPARARRRDERRRRRKERRR